MTLNLYRFNKSKSYNRTRQLIKIFLKNLNNPKFIDRIMPIMVLLLISQMFLFTFSCVKTSQSAFRYNIKVREKAGEIYQIFQSSETSIQVLSDTVKQAYDSKQINNSNYNEKFLSKRADLVKAIINEIPSVQSVWLRINNNLPSSEVWYFKNNGKILLCKKNVFDVHKGLRKHTTKNHYCNEEKGIITVSSPIYQKQKLIGFVGVNISIKSLESSIIGIQKQFTGSDVFLLNDANKPLVLCFDDATRQKVENMSFMRNYIKKVSNKDNIVVYQERWGQNTALIFKMKNGYKIVMSCPNKFIYKNNTRILEAIYLLLAVIFLLATIYLYNKKKMIILNKQLEDGISTQKIILNSSPMGIAIKNTQGKYIDCNEKFAKMLNVTPGQVIGQDDYAFSDKETADSIMAKDDYVKLKKVAIHEEDWFVNKIGQRFLLDNYRIPLFNSDNELIGLLITVNDVTKRREEQEYLRHAKEVAEKATEMKSSFLANMSHEIRTPLNGVLGFLQLLETTELSDVQKEFVGNAQKSSEILLNIINEVLDISKIEAGKMSIDSTSFNIRSAVEDVVTIATSNEKAEGININALIRSDVPQRVLGDPSRIKQILTNLIGNAVKFTKQGEVVVYVNKIKETEDEVAVCFKVKDTGIGIPKDKLESIFGAFIQADASTTRNFGGTGLGLAISKKLANLMNGDIEVISEVGKGSTFMLTLTFKKDLSSSLTTDSLTKNLNGITVLVIDDKSTDKKIIAHYINDANGFVIESSSINQAIEILKNKENNISVVLIDSKIQKTINFDFKDYIKKEFDCEIPLILYTSLTKRGDAILAKQKGFTGYLTKPIKKQELLEGIAIAVNGQKQTLENKFISKHLIKEAKFDSQSKILVVEDSELNIKLILNIFKNANLNCDIAINGREAIESFIARDYDIILMDCELPEMDGYEATKQIRIIEADKKHTPIIAMTANVLNEDKEKCYQAGMDDYLSKPININQLFEILGKYIKVIEKSDENFIKEEEKIIDIINKIVEELSFSKEEACDIFNRYLEMFPQTIINIQNELNIENYENIYQLVHKLKGASANLRVSKIVQICDELYVGIRSQDKESCQMKLDEMNNYFEILTVSFKTQMYY